MDVGVFYLTGILIDESDFLKELLQLEPLVQLPEAATGFGDSGCCCVSSCIWNPEGRSLKAFPFRAPG